MYQKEKKKEKKEKKSNNISNLGPNNKTFLLFSLLSYKNSSREVIRKWSMNCSGIKIHKWL